MSTLFDKARKMMSNNRKKRSQRRLLGVIGVVLAVVVSGLLVGKATALVGGDTLRNSITADSALFWEPADGDETAWQKVDPNTPVDASSKLRLRLAFNLPADALSDDHAIQYKLPDGLTLPNTADDKSDAFAIYAATTVTDANQTGAERIGTATVKDDIVTVRIFDDVSAAAKEAATLTQDSSADSASTAPDQGSIDGFVDFDFGFDTLALDADGYVKLQLNDAQALSVTKQTEQAPTTSETTPETNPDAAEVTSANSEATSTTTESTPATTEPTADSTSTSSDANGAEAADNSTAADASSTTSATDSAAAPEANASDSDSTSSATSDSSSENDTYATATHVAELPTINSVSTSAQAAKSLRLRTVLRAAASTTTGTDFKQYLTNETSYKKLGNNGWEPATTFNDGDTAQITLAYAGIDPKTIASTKNTIYYNLPNGVTVDKESSGPVTDTNGKNIGTYKIGTDGVVTVTFTDEFLNQSGAVSGKVQFTAKVSNTGTGNQGTISFGGSAANITVVTPVEDKHDINSSKDGSLSSDRTKASYTVTVGTTKGTGETVSIQDRIDNNQVTNASPAYDASSFHIYKVDASGNQTEITSSYSPTFPSDSNGKGFSYSGLPALAAGEKYKVTYDVNLNVQDKSKGVWVNNYAGGASGNHNQYSWKSVGWNIESEIQKTGTFDKNSGLISWRIKVNPNHKDITSGKWTVYDALPTGCTLYGQYTVWGANTGTLTTGGSWNDTVINYTFPASGLSDAQKTDTYYIDFWTTAPSGDTTVTNKGQVWEGNTGSAESEVNVPVEHRKFDVVKTHTNESNFNKLYTETWHSEVTLPDTQLSTFTYTDTIKDAVDGNNNSMGTKSHYATAGDLENSFKQYLYVQVDDYSQYQYKGASERTYYYYKDRSDLSGPTTDLTFKVTYYDANDQVVQPTDYSTPVKKFTVSVSTADGHKIFGRKLVLDQYHTFSDTSTAVEGATWTLANKGDINGTKSSEVTQDIPIPKTFDKQVDTGDSNVETRYKSGNAEVNYDKQSGILNYRLILNTTEADQGTITITDTLPKGEKLVDGSVVATFFENEYTWNKKSNYADIYDENHKWLGQFTFVDGTNPSYTTTDNADGTTTLTIKISDYVYAGGYPNIAVAYKVSVVDDEYWKDPKSTSKTYTNTASWNGHTTDQSTTVKRDVANVTKTGVQLDKDGKPVVLKDNKPTTSPSNKVRYYVDINPAGKDLNPGGNTITLTDTMENTSRYDPQIDLSSVKLYAYDVSAEHHYAESGVISSDRYSVKYDQATARLTVTVPDELACVLVYDYKLDSDGITSGSEVKNNCSLDGTWSSSSDIKLSQMESSAEATHKSIEMYKVDEDNYQKPLEGTFKLEKWDTTSKSWVVKNASFTTTGGKFTWDVGVANPPLDTDALYRIIETKAPDGYGLDSTPHYFIWMATNSSKDTAYNNSGASSATKPDGLTNIAKENISIFKNSGGSLYVTNKYTRLSVKKEWAHEDGSSATAPAGANVTVQLRRSIQVNDPNQTCAVTIREEGTPQGTDTWKAERTLDVVNIQRGSKLVIPFDFWGPSVEVYINNVLYQTFTSTQSNMTLTIDADKLGGSTAEVLLKTTNSGNIPTIDASKLRYTNPPVIDSNDELVDTVTLSGSNNWAKYWENLPTKNSSGQAYHYKVLETSSSVDAKSTSYSNNGGIQTGTITVTNTLPEGYELPKTGGSGTVRYLVTGAAIAVTAAAALLVRRKRLS